ncbi:MAG: hypothetical protein IJ109_07830 [Firmicutes bacterium]|nr:hypothetical protein [Bacillota bacterium]
MLSYLGETITAAEKEAQYDAAAKRLLSDRQILAWILKYTVAEYSGMQVREIIGFIGQSQVSGFPVYPGLAGQSVWGMSQESAVPNEGKLTYDIRFQSVIPLQRQKKNEYRIIIDVEAQKDSHPGYDLVTRGILYASRMLSDQIGRNVNLATAEYDNLQKVYSIWICMSASKREANTVSSYRVVHKPLHGSYEDHSRHDLLQVVMIRLPRSKHIDKTENQPNELQQMLILLFSDTDAKTKRSILQEKYGLKVTEEMNEEINQMCNLSQIIKEDALNEGNVQGREEKERENVLSAIEEGLPKETILRIFKISAEKYGKYLSMV